MDNPYVIWAIIFLSAALILFFCELFLPSAGLIALAAAGSLIVGIAMLFAVDTKLGLIGALVAVIAVPFLMALAVKIWPSTPIGRLLSLQSPTGVGEEDEVSGSVGGVPAAKILVGTKGTAVTDLRPIGICSIDNQRTDCLAEGGVIQAGTAVVVTAIDGMQVKVKTDES